PVLHSTILCYSSIASCSQSFRLLLFNHPAPPKPSTLSLHDALPISAATLDSAITTTRPPCGPGRTRAAAANQRRTVSSAARSSGDRKSTRLNSSHVEISYAVFCLKKKKKRIAVQKQDIKYINKQYT